MRIIGSHSYNQPGFKIAEHDLSGNIDNVELTIMQDGTFKSWRVILTGIGVSAQGVISDLLHNSEIANLVVEQKDHANKRDPSFSGMVLVSKINLAPKSTHIELTGTGPVNYLP